MDTPDRAAAPAANRAEVTPAAAPSSSSLLCLGDFVYELLAYLLLASSASPFRFVRRGTGSAAPAPDGIGRFFSFLFFLFRWSSSVNLSANPCFGSGGSDGNFFSQVHPREISRVSFPPGKCWLIWLSLQVLAGSRCLITWFLPRRRPVPEDWRHRLAFFRRETATTIVVGGKKSEFFFLSGCYSRYGYLHRGGWGTMLI
jgi:hypothetical protein